MTKLPLNWVHSQKQGTLLFASRKHRQWHVNTVPRCPLCEDCRLPLLHRLPRNAQSGLPSCAWWQALAGRQPCNIMRTLQSWMVNKGAGIECRKGLGHMQGNCTFLQELPNSPAVHCRHCHLKLQYRSPPRLLAAQHHHAALQALPQCLGHLVFCLCRETLSPPDQLSFCVPFFQRSVQECSSR